MLQARQFRNEATARKWKRLPWMLLLHMRCQKKPRTVDVMNVRYTKSSRYLPLTCQGLRMLNRDYAAVDFTSRKPASYGNRRNHRSSLKREGLANLVH